MNRKRIFAVLATGSMMTAGFSVTANAETPVGDHNKDGVVNAKDAAVILQYAAAVGAKNFEGTLPEFVEFLENGQKESTPEIEESAWREAYSKKLAAYLKANPEQDVTDPLRAMWDLKDLNGDYRTGCDDDYVWRTAAVIECPVKDSLLFLDYINEGDGGMVELPFVRTLEEFLDRHRASNA